MHRSMVRYGALVVAGVLALTACGGAGGSSGGGASAAGGQSGFDATEPVRFALPVVGSQWDPHLSRSQNADAPMMVLVYDRLLKLNGDGGVDPQLATSYTFSPDGLQLTMQLREDVTFHDGQHFDASVAVANLQRAKGPESTVAAQLAVVTDVVADGAYQIRLTLGEKDPTLVMRLATTTGAMISPAGLTSSNLQQAPAGSGPFTLQSFDTQRAVLVRNPNYWDKKLLVPDRVEIIGVGDESARLNLLTSGDADIINVTATTWAQAKDLDETDDYDLHIYNGALQQLLFLNASIAPLDNPQVRRALNLAIDRDAIADALDGSCAANSQVFPPAYPGYVESLKYDHNVDEAKQILADQGVGPFTIETLQANFEPARTIAEMTQGMLATIGVTLELVPTEPALVRSVFGEGKYGGMVHSQATTYFDPSVLMATHVNGQLDPGKAGTPLVPGVNAARVLDLGSPQRKAAYEDLDRKLFEQPTHVPLCNQSIALLTRSNMVGLDQPPYSQFSAGVDIRGVGFAG